MRTTRGNYQLTYEHGDQNTAIRAAKKKAIAYCKEKGQMAVIVSENVNYDGAFNKDIDKFGKVAKKILWSLDKHNESHSASTAFNGKHSSTVEFRCE